MRRFLKQGLKKIKQIIHSLGVSHTPPAIKNSVCKLVMENEIKEATG